MQISKPVKLPAGYAPAFAIGLTGSDGNLVMIGPDSPLPIAQSRPTASAAVSGEAGESAIVGPFIPSPGLPVYLALSGDWQGCAALTRSTDGGATRLPLTVGGAPWGAYTANICEAVWEEGEAGAALYLELTLESGSVTYRVSQ